MCNIHLNTSSFEHDQSGHHYFEAMNSRPSFGTTSTLRDRHISFGGAQVTCRTNSDQVDALLYETYRSMLATDVEQSAAIFSVEQTPDGFALRGSSPESTTTSPELVLAWLKPRILTAFIDFRRDLVWLHSAVVSCGNGATLLAGPSGAGKSTLSTQLCKEGWKYLSDEVAPLVVGSNEVLAYPQSPSRRMAQEFVLSAEAVNELPKQLWTPPEISVRNDPMPVDRVVLVKFSFGSPPILRQVDAGEAVLQLLKNTLGYSPDRSAAVSRLVNLAQSVPCFELEYGDAREASMILDRAVRSIPTCHN